CLMDNHVHLLVHATLPDLSIFMNRVESAYAIYFNKRHDRVGTLFQGRYSSVPINDDPQLMLAVRYIHHNPVKKGEPLENKWSSYTEYTTTAAICNTGFVESIFGGRKQFIAFHQKDGEPYSGIPRCRMSESQAEEIAHSVLDGINPYDVRGLPKERRDAILREMRMRGLSIRQIERITSVGRNIIAKVK
ncbi:MAG: transposase, partial [Eggerthellaceae bacterium]|nr:transposase [Eggerthellaceae bacterium]